MTLDKLTYVHDVKLKQYWNHTKLWIQVSFQVLLSHVFICTLLHNTSDGISICCTYTPHSIRHPIFYKSSEQPYFFVIMKNWSNQATKKFLDFWTSSTTSAFLSYINMHVLCSYTSLWINMTCFSCIHMTFLFFPAPSPRYWAFSNILQACIHYPPISSMTNYTTFGNFEIGQSYGVTMLHVWNMESRISVLLLCYKYIYQPHQPIHIRLQFWALRTSIQPLF